RVALPRARALRSRSPEAAVAVRRVIGRVAARVGAGLRARLPAREREAEDGAVDHPPLLAEPAAVIGEAVLLADRLDPGRDLRIAGARHVREEVVLDLVAEVAARHVE